MPNETSVPAPGSVEAQAIAELEKEGHVVEGKEPAPAESVKEPVPPKEEPKVEAPKPEVKVEEKKPDRSPKMVETWKLKVAEDQKENLEKELTDLKAKVEELSKQKAPITQAQSEDIKEEIARLAKDKDVDVEFLTGFADSILKRAETKYKPSVDVETTLKKLQEKQQLDEELSSYSSEFDKDVTPLLAEYQLSGEALSQLKSTLRDYAFSETYAKVPLKEIFAIKQAEFNLSVPKKSSEGKGIKTRATDVVDIDNMSEEDFAKLPADKIEEFVNKKSSSSWQRK